HSRLLTFTLFTAKTPGSRQGGQLRSGQRSVVFFRLTVSVSVNFFKRMNSPRHMATMQIWTTRRRLARPVKYFPRPASPTGGCPWLASPAATVVAPGGEELVGAAACAGLARQSRVRIRQAPVKPGKRERRRRWK